jgi:hypothetical protein
MSDCRRSSMDRDHEDIQQSNEPGHFVAVHPAMSAPK